MKNYDFMLIYKKYNKKTEIIKSLLFALIFAILITLISGYFMGYRVFSVLGRSSEPDIHYGSIVIDYKVPFEEIKVGDYVTWTRTGNGFVTHKVISIDVEKREVTTSQTDYGASGPVNPDAPVSYDENVVGKVIFTIPKLGSIFLDFKNMIITNKAINVLGIMTLVLSIYSYYLFKGLVTTKTFYLREY